MILLVVFAFLAGIVTILSPCILPILPLLLSGTTGHGHQKPLGIVTGFVASFTFFTLMLATIVQATGISADTFRLLSIVIILGFGVSLLFPQLQTQLEVLLSRLARLAPISTTTGNGYLSGLLLGLSLGLLWTPCVGPILASVISLALTGSVTGTTIIITFAYSFGTALPMLGITYGGQRVLQAIPSIARRANRIQQVFGVFMILTALAIALNLDRKFQTFILETFPTYGTGLTQFENTTSIQEALKNVRSQPTTQTTGQVGSAAPELIPGGQWFNSEPFTLEQQRGKVVLIDFWTYTCINCIRTLPYLRDWHEKYADEGLVIVGVHTPEFEFEREAQNVQQAVEDFGLKYPIMQDNDFATWRAYNNHYWPAKYLIDAQGKIRYTHFGEGEYEETERRIQELLQEAGKTVSETLNTETYQVRTRTPETYLGWQRMAGFASIERAQPNQTREYHFPERLALNSFAYQGIWSIREEFSLPQPGSQLSFRFASQNVYLVIKATNSTGAPVRVQLDGQPLNNDTAGEDVDQESSTVSIQENRLYHLIQLPEPGEHTLLLEFPSGNLEVYAFTFG